MPITKLVTRMPPLLLGLFLVFASIPVISLLLGRTPHEILYDGGPIKLTLFLITYWVVPLLICYSLVIKHHWFLPLYLFLSALFLTELLLMDASFASGKQLSHLLLIGTMLYVGLLFGNKNFLYPLLSRDPRFWRRSARYRIGRPVQIQRRTHETPVRGYLLDCSITGLALSIPAKSPVDEIDPEEDKVIAGIKKGSRLQVNVNTDGGKGPKEHSLPLEVVWSIKAEDGERKLGCYALDRPCMKAYLAAEVVKKKAAVHLPELGGDYALEQYIQKTALILWCVCIAMSAIMPTVTIW